ncbi:helix-turn-helix transcriptional regulator [Streptomyces spectabilis]|uniref:helix-turn-helix transcriptional regulator n=1 Tax=Streptomyces spectabilis TaxID=68270 RepID=UPI0033C7D688
MSNPVGDSMIYMWENCGRPLSLGDIAAFVRYSKFHFARKFRKEAGCSPGRFLCTVRMARGKQLLSTSMANVSDIASSVGYQSLGTFTTRFTEVVGLTPSQYRNSSRADFTLFDFAVPGVVHDYDPRGCVTGRLIGTPRNRGTRTHVSVFSSARPLMPPIAAGFVDPEGGFFFGGLPCGTWLMRAIAVERGSEDSLAEALVGVSEEFDVRPSDQASAEVVLQEPTTGMVPTLLSVPGLDRYLSSLLRSSTRA